MPILPDRLTLLFVLGFAAHLAAQGQRCAQDVPCLTELQRAHAETYQAKSQSLAARLEKAQNDAKKAADQQLQRQLGQIQQSFQAEVQQLETQREGLEQELKTALKCETPGFDWQLISCAKKEVKKEPAK